MPVEKVHLHEVGALDSIVDIVGTVFALEWFGADRIVVVAAQRREAAPSRRRTACIPCRRRRRCGCWATRRCTAGRVAKELLTPTGALAAERLCDVVRADAGDARGAQSGTAPAMPISTARRTSCASSSAKPRTSGTATRVVVIECEIDDMNPQIFGVLMDRLYAAGALDVFYAPVQMKKNRPGTLMTIVARPARSRRARRSRVSRDDDDRRALQRDGARVSGARDRDGRDAAGRGAVQGGAPGRAGAERAARVRRPGSPCRRACAADQRGAGAGCQGVVGAMKFFLTTAIDFVNSRPHLGTAYEKITADVIARYKRLAGFDTWFLMGNDEHSQNVFRRAQELGQDPLAYCDEMERVFTGVWKRLDVSYDDFIRTTDARRHHPGRAAHGAGLLRRRRHLRGRVRGLVLRQLRGLQAGEGSRRRALSDASDDQAGVDPREELVLPAVEVPEAAARSLRGATRRSSSPRCGATRSCAWSKPASRTSRSAGPASRGAFRCRSIRRQRRLRLVRRADQLRGGGRATAGTTSRVSKWWPADLHIIGKDITRFHCVIWPAMLMSAKLPLPGQVFGHGWISVGNQRMSKSLGNVVDPIEAAERFGTDPLRLYLVKEVPYGGDGDFTWERLGEKYNADLANNLGNLVSRVSAMTERYRNGRLTGGAAGRSGWPAVATQALADYRAAMDRFALHEGVAAAFRIVDAANLFIADTQPWALAKDEAQARRLTGVLAEAAEAVRIAAVLLLPVMPSSAAEILRRMGEPRPAERVPADRRRVAHERREADPERRPAVAARRKQEQQS